MTLFHIPRFISFLLLLQLFVNSIYGCIEQERQALLTFKQSLDNSSLLTSWKGSDCCSWTGVDCDGTIGHVVSLSYNENYQDDDVHLVNVEWISNLMSLRNLTLVDMDLSRARNLFQVLTKLPSLSVLSLSSYSLNNTHISPPTQINSINFISRIQHLDLSDNSFHGPFPSFLQNMTSLMYLDLSNNEFNSSVPYWLGNLKTLQHLMLQGNSLDRIEGGMSMFLWNRCSLKSLDLSRNKFNNESLETYMNVTGCDGYALEELNLGMNNLKCHIPNWLMSFKNLKILYLHDNSLYGSIPASIQSLSNLEGLSFRDNNLNGPIPASIGKLSRLTYLSLQNNELSGVVPESLGQLVNLEKLDLSGNSLQGFLTEIHLSNLSELIYFVIANNHLTVKVKSGWVPSFQLQFIYMGSCKLVTEFPKWIESQVHLKILDLSNSSISGLIPNWLILFENMTILNLGHNSFNGSIPSTLGKLSRLRELNLANNMINGSIPITFCNMKRLQILDLSANLLSGEIPNCWDDSQTSLSTVKLSSNKLTGFIPSSFGRLSGLSSLHLSSNNLQGEIPLSLKKCANLIVLDLGDNGLYGNIPTWIGQSLLRLVILRLRDNSLVGSVPSQLCQLPFLKILDIAENNLSNTIPRCLGNLSGMISSDPNSKSYSELYLETVSIVIQGRVMEYSTVLRFLVTMDFSNNDLGGMIPEELTNLNGLHGLNFSHNHLIGNIPKSIGNMKSLQSLDFSRNHLSGSIPPSLSDLYSLSHLNMSYNNLSGPIPTGSQLQTLNDDPSIYLGNPELCGAPVLKKCTVDKLPSEDEDNDKDDKFDNICFYIVVTLGYATGVWGVIGVLIFKKKWRYAYFRFAGNAMDSIYVAVVVKTWYLKRKMGFNQ